MRVKFFHSVIGWMFSFLFLNSTVYSQSVSNCTSYSKLVDDADNWTMTVFMDQYHRVPDGVMGYLYDAETRELIGRSLTHTFSGVKEGAYYYQVEGEEYCKFLVTIDKVIEANDDTCSFLMTDERAGEEIVLNVLDNDCMKVNGYFADVPFPMDRVKVRLETEDSRLYVNEKNQIVLRLRGDEKGEENISYRVSVDSYRSKPAQIHIEYERKKEEVITIEITEVVVPPEEVTIPEYFSPNGDGIADVWRIEKLDTHSDYILSIFNRHGKLLLRYENDFEGWDGYYNGHPVPSQDYWYVLNLHDIDVDFRGHFTLIR